jgi:hypothetical protein
MAMLLDLLGRLAAQDVHDVAGTKGDAAGLLHPVDGAQQLARGVGAVPDLGGKQAVVAVLAGRAAIGFAKILQQAHAPAVGGLGQAEQGVELAAHHLLEVSPAGLSSIMRRWFTTSCRP